MTTAPPTTAPAPTAPVRPAWDTRCVRGCGAVVLDLGNTCGDCQMHETRLAWRKTGEAFRKEFGWLLGKEPQR